MRLVWGSVVTVVESAEGLQELTVRLDEGSEGRAIAYTRLVGVCAQGERVLVNTTAVDLALGTGGQHFVVARGERGVVIDAPSGGHVMKLRYTPLQCDVVAVEAPESPHHDVMRDARSLGGMPVVCCGLHSQVPLVAAAIKSARPETRVVYCMSDEAALPAALSGVLARAKRAGLVDALVTCGQAFGGDLEAVNLHSGLLAARSVSDADVVIAGIGPGIVGTGTPFGHGGVAQGQAINAVAALGGRPVAVLRLSFADSRARHQGVSHHTISALASVALARATVPVPALAPRQETDVDLTLDAAGVWAKHDRADAAGALPDLRGVEVRTMGRGRDDDPAFFAACFAAGEVAATLVP